MGVLSFSDDCGLLALIVAAAVRTSWAASTTVAGAMIAAMSLFSKFSFLSAMARFVTAMVNCSAHLNRVCKLFLADQRFSSLVFVHHRLRNTKTEHILFLPSSHFFSNSCRHLIENAEIIKNEHDIHVQHKIYI